MANSKPNINSEAAVAVSNDVQYRTSRGGAKWLTFEYALAMGSLVLSTWLVGSVLSTLFGAWSGQASTVTSYGGSWLFDLFSLSMVTAGTGVVVTSVAAVVLSVLALILFRRVSRTIPEREGYTGRIAYKAVTYGAFSALVIPALALVAKLVGILISSLLFIGVSGAGHVYKSLYLAEFLPYALSLGLIVVVGMLVGKIITGSNKSKLATWIVIGASAAVMVAGAITVAVQSHGKGSEGNYYINRTGNSIIDDSIGRDFHKFSDPQY